MRFFATSIFLCFFVSFVNAQPLYLEQYINSKVDSEKLDKTHKQIKEHSDVELKDNLFVSPFHKQNSKVDTDKQSFCVNCHQNKPHKLNKRKRSFLNMHSAYISCETCHFKPENTQLSYKWFNYNHNTNAVVANRITPFYKNEPVIVLSEHEIALKTKKNWNINSTIKNARLKLRLHTPLNDKGPDCIDCHNNTDQLIDLESLGFDENEIKNLQQHVIPRFFSRFNKDDQRLRMTDFLQ